MRLHCIDFEHFRIDNCTCTYINRFYRAICSCLFFLTIYRKRFTCFDADENPNDSIDFIQYNRPRFIVSIISQRECVHVTITSKSSHVWAIGRWLIDRLYFISYIKGNNIELNGRKTDGMGFNWNNFNQTTHLNLPLTHIWRISDVKQ